MQIRTEFLDSFHDVDKFVECAKQLEAKNSIKNRPIKWYLTSDSEIVINRAINFFKKEKRKIITGRGKIAHVEYIMSGYERVIMDIELLSRCDELIVTGGSTFGFVASMKRGKFHYSVYSSKLVATNSCEIYSFSRDVLFPVF